LNHYLGVHHQVLSMHLLDVLASLVRQFGMSKPLSTTKKEG
jgi:hypothetical protein